MSAVAMDGFADEASAALCERIANYLRSGETSALIAVMVTRDGDAELAVDYVHASPLHLVLASVALLEVTTDQLAECDCGRDHAHQLTELRAAAAHLRGALTITDRPLTH